MKKLISMSLALLILFGSVFSFVGTNIVYAQEEAWTEEDFLYSSPGNIIAYSDQGMAKQKKTKTLVFPEGTKSVRGNYSLDHMGDKDRFNREFGRGKVYDLVVFPDSVTSLGYASFYTGKIGKVKLSQNLKTIGGLAFFSCELSEVDLPDTLVNIEHNAFERNNLQEITISKSVKTIEQYAFSRNKLHTIKVLGNPNINSKGVFHNQEVEYRPKQNPFYENHFGFNGNQGFKSIPNELRYENGEFIFDKNVDSVELEFDYNNDMYQGKMTIYNPNKYSIDTQTDLTGQDIDEKDNKIDDLTKNIKDLENQIKDLNDKKQEDQSKIDELKEKLESCKDNGEKLKQE
ncbi:leucine-rich repeat domain-containing protein, partial [Anaerococcus octavius]